MKAAFSANWCVILLMAGAARAEVDFDTQVVPVLSKAGCNAAACHGGTAGRGGFRLSLFGGDPDLDYRTIVRELEGRRVNLAEPHDSLLLAKPLGRLEHGGGKRLSVGSDAAEILATWVKDGAPRLHLRRLERLEVHPREISAQHVPAEVPLTVQAHFDDGTQTDVRGLAVYAADDESAVTISPEGKLKVLRPGRHVVLVRFGPSIEPVLITTPLGSEPVNLSGSPRHNWIDDEILKTLEALQLAPSPQCDDAAFMRRIYLDLTGSLPAPADIRRFLTDGRSDKRERLTGELLQSDAFVDFWTYHLMRVLRLRPPGGDHAAAEALYDWLHEAVGRDAAWDEIAQALLTAEGDTHQVGPATFHRLAAGPREEAEFVSEALMGVRMRCANCHNHPLDRWTQDDYHGLAQIFARLERGRVVQLGERGEVTHPRTGEAAVPRIPGEAWLDASGDGRQRLAEWLTHPENPFFARAMVGRIWRDLMGRGLVEPVDDLRATNPATHPELLERLADDFAENGYRLRHTIRLICTSAAYARTSRPTGENAADESFYSHALVRPLDAEVLADAIGDVTGLHDAYGERPSGTRAITLIDPALESQTLDVLGRCDRSEPCEPAAGRARGIAARLHLLNGPLLNRRLVAEEGRLRKLIDSEALPEKVVEEFYLRALCRPPSAAEVSYWDDEIGEAPDVRSRNERLEDFVWSLLNSREFMTNH